MQHAFPNRESAAPVAADDRVALTEVDVVVVGGGAAGLPTALFARWAGNSVALLEKADQLGGTMLKAAACCWVPNNRPMREHGIEDPEDDFLRYCARVAAPERYDGDDRHLGLAPWEYETFKAIYESSSPAIELLAERDALPYKWLPEVPDYFSTLPGFKTPLGRVLIPRDCREDWSDGGAVGIGTLAAAAERDGVDVRLGHRVQRLIRDGATVVGVEATTVDGQQVSVGARKGVVFASGGFAHDDELRSNHLTGPMLGGCAARSNEGDFIRIASSTGAQLRNMNYAWGTPVSLEKAIAKRPDLRGTVSVNGDSMVLVNKYGHRVVNEKLVYNELAAKFLEWDADGCEYPNLVLIQIWDQRSQDHSPSTANGRLIVPAGSDDAHVIKGETLEDLAAAIDERLARYAPNTGGARLSDDFLSSLSASIERFNGFAERGTDEDFGRGEDPVALIFNGDVCPEPAAQNPTMFPIAERGPFYAGLLTAGMLDTKGGPKTDVDGRVLDDMDAPIPGLYGVGNCVASPSRRGYLAAGATIGPIIGMAYRTAQAADRDSA